MTTTKQFQLGSISTGTCRPEDLLPTFTRTLQGLEPESEYVKEAFEIMATWGFGEPTEEIEAIDEVLSNIEHEINNSCPPFVYFGPHPGDPSDFGFFPDWDALNEALKDPEHTLIAGQLWKKPRDEAVLIKTDFYDSWTVMDLDRNLIWTTA